MTGAPAARTMLLVGCGHVGGSLALALRAAGRVDRVLGVDADPGAAGRAVALGICDASVTLEEGAPAAGLVVLAVPVRASPDLAGRLARVVRPATLVTDVGSTKGAVVRACEEALAGRARFVGGHPIAGTERSGPDAADARLFDGRRVVLTPTPTTDRGALVEVAALWRSVGAEVVELDPDGHDAALAAVSHLPHAVAYSLAGAVGEAHAGDALRGLAGSGFRDTTRVAATPPRMWIDVFLENRAPLLSLLDAFTARLGALRAAIEAGDAAAIERLLERARAERERILHP